MQHFWIGEWQVEVDAGEIKVGDNTITLRHKVMQVLVYLACNSERVVTREELVAHIWQGNESVGDKGLTNAIWQLRAAFSQESNNEQEVIQTLPKKGYQLMLPVTEGTTRQSLTASGKNTRTILLILPLVLTMIVLSIWKNVSSPPQWQDLRATRLTSSPGIEHGARVSPDGKQLLLLKGQKDKVNLYIRSLTDLHSPKDIQLTNQPGTIKSATWSPSGESIAFIRSDATASCSIVFLEVQSLEHKHILPCQNSSASHIEFGKKDNEMMLFDVDPRTNKSAFYHINLQSNEQQELPIPTSPRYLLEGEMRLSPDKTWLALSRSPGINAHDLYLFSLNTQKLKRLTYDSAYISGFNWYPDSQSLVFSSNRGGKTALWTIPVNNTVPTPLGITGFEPSYALQGQMLIYQTQQFAMALSEIDLDESNSMQMTIISPKLPSGQVAISPSTGSMIYGDIQQTNTLRIKNPESQQESVITIPEQYQQVFFPRLSPDENKLLFLAKSPRNEYFQIFVLNRQNQRIQQVSDVTGDQFAPAWSQDGQSIFASTAITGRFDIWEYSLNNLPPKQITHNGGGLLRQMQNGYLYSKADANGLYIQNANMEEVLLLPDLNQADWGNWALTKDAVIYIRRTTNKDQLVSYQLANGQSNLLAEFDSGVIPAGHRIWLNRSTNHLYITQNLIAEADIMVRKYRSVF